MVSKQILRKVGLLGMSLALFACGDSAPVKEETVVEEVNSELLEEEMDVFESPDNDYHLPSALQVASIFKKSGLTYNAEVTNKVENVTNYTSDISGKLNFGVYSADLAYCITNEQANDARNFISAVQTLAEQQGMESIFEDKGLMTRFDNNLEIQDSIESIIVEIHEKSQEYLEDNEQDHIAAVHYAGAWVEGMYLGVYDYKNNGEKDGIAYKITEQIEILNNIIKGLKDKRNTDPELAWLIADLEEVQSTYDSFDSVKAYSESDSNEMSLTAPEIEKLGTLIEGIRLKIVEN